MASFGVKGKSNKIDWKSRSKVWSGVALLTNLLKGLIYRLSNFKLENKHAVHMACHDIGASVRLHILHRVTESASSKKERKTARIGIFVNASFRWSIRH